MIRIVAGEQAEFLIKLRDGEGDPFDLTDFDKASLFLPVNGETLEVKETANANGSSIERQEPYVLGRLKVVLKTLDTRNLKVAERQDLGLTIDNSVDPAPRSKNLTASLSVEPNPST